MRRARDYWRALPLLAKLIVVGAPLLAGSAWITRAIAGELDSVIKQDVAALKAHQEDTADRLDRIESKIDKLLERGP